MQAKLHRKFFFFIGVLLTSFLYSQQKTIKGKLSNAENGEAISFAEIILVSAQGERKATSTDFDGFYEFLYDDAPDSLVVKMTDFQNKSIFLGKEFPHEYNITLVPAIVKKEKEKEKVRMKSIDGVLIKKKKKYKNPAFEILEKVIANKPRNNPEKLNFYEYENYNRMEVSMSNFGKKLEKKKVFRDIREIMDAAKDVAGNDGKPVMPIFISENISDFYYRKSPHNTAEIIKKTKVEGIGIEDGSMFSQLLSSTFIKYNFYQNYIRILGKDFLSPINDNFKLLYDYELVDRNLQIDNQGYYRIDFQPKRPSDLAFQGTIIIAHSDYALFRTDAKVMPSANLNFINNLRIQQEMSYLADDETWFPSKTRVFVETAKPGKESVGIFLKYYASAKDIKVNKPIADSRFDKEIIVLDDAQQNDENYWNKNRHDSLSTAEKKMYSMIDQVKKLPSVRTYLDIIEIISNGYYKAGKISIGPYLYTIAPNDYEGLRLRAGFRTNQNFSKKWILSGYLAYGFKDAKLKYGASADYIFSREPWTQAGVSYSHDLGQVAFMYEDFSIRRNNIFDAFSRTGKMTVRRPFWQDTYQAYIQTDIVKSLTQKITLKHFNFDPTFPFSYAENDGSTLHNFSTTEVIAETIWRPGRRILQTSNNKQLNLKDNIYQPTITFRYTRGVKGILGSDFDYNKFAINVQQVIPMGILGRGEYSLTAGITPNKVPYPLLENHLGNSFTFYNKYAYNTMNFFEFTSNKFASIQYTQNFEGLLTNSIPLIKKLSWRNHATFNYLVGSLDPSFIEAAGGNLALRSLGNKPFMEVGYGISNIFRFLRIDFIHRLTHLEHLPHHEAPPKFRIKIAFQIRL